MSSSAIDKVKQTQRWFQLCLKQKRAAPKHQRTLSWLYLYLILLFQQETSWALAEKRKDADDLKIRPDLNCPICVWPCHSLFACTGILRLFAVSYLIPHKFYALVLVFSYFLPYSLQLTAFLIHKLEFEVFLLCRKASRNSSLHLGNDRLLHFYYWSILLSFKVKVQENASEVFYVKKQNNVLFYREKDLT